MTREKTRKNKKNRKNIEFLHKKQSNAHFMCTDFSENLGKVADNPNKDIHKIL